MGYLFLSVALAGGVLKAYCGKRLSFRINNSESLLVANFTRMLICTAIGFLTAFVSEKSMLAFATELPVLFVAGVSGVFSAGFVLLWLISVKKGAYTLVDVFVMSGTLIPMVGSLMLFGEKISSVQWIGFLLVICGVLCLVSYNNAIKTKLDIKSLVLLVAVAIASGSADFAQKIFVNITSSVSNAVFNFYTYLFATATIGTGLLCKKIKAADFKTEVKKTIPYVLFMAVGLFVNSYFKVEAARFISAAKLYPLNQGAALLLGMVMAAVFFKEKITAKSVMGIFLGFLGICIINMI